MPFQSGAQLRVCVGKAMDDISSGKSPKWNCEEFACHNNSSPLCKKIKSQGIGSKIQQGPRGGYYFEVKADDKTRKIYIPEKNRAAMLKKFGVNKKSVKLGGKKSVANRKKAPFHSPKKSPKPMRKSVRKSPKPRKSVRKVSP